MIIDEEFLENLKPVNNIKWVIFSYYFQNDGVYKTLLGAFENKNDSLNALNFLLKNFIHEPIRFECRKTFQFNGSHLGSTSIKSIFFTMCGIEIHPKTEDENFNLLIRSIENYKFSDNNYEWYIECKYLEERLTSILGVYRTETDVNFMIEFLSNKIDNKKFLLKKCKMNNFEFQHEVELHPFNSVIKENKYILNSLIKNYIDVNLKSDDGNVDDFLDELNDINDFLDELNENNINVVDKMNELD